QFKLFLVGKFADREIAIKFGLGAVVSSFLGAVLLGAISTIEPIYEYPFFNRTASITPLKLLIALLLMVFVWLESRASEKRLKFERSDLWLGGLLSGFFGGLSGQQGALRSIFLLKYDLTKETYIATSIVIACLIDVARLPVYLNRFNPAIAEENTTLLVCACLSAFVGAFIGARLMRKVTMQAVQRTVAAMLVLIACLMASGII
ncbi:MAG: TSUP family transporter, partial [Chloroherpetonaceae bacterium]